MGDEGFEAADERKVLLHVGGQHHVHHQSPKAPLLPLGLVHQEIAAAILAPQNAARCIGF